MNVILGIDVGGSTTKIVGYYENGNPFGRAQVEAADPQTSAYGALGKFINENKLNLKQVKQIVLTGVGAALFGKEIYCIPACHVDEFQAIGLGGLALSKKKEALVISMGTGTAFVRAAKDGIKHIGGSGVGGGTVLGLCGALCNARSFDTVVELAHNGDLGKVDSDGYLYFAGRKKELIITGGVNVYPKDIEDKLSELEEIKECAAFAYADERLGEVVAVAVVPAPSYELTRKRIQIFCAKNLADFQQPHKIFILDELPRNAMGKVIKIDLPKVVAGMEGERI